MPRSEAMVRAQKKYFEKIKKENGEAYQKFKDCLSKSRKKRLMIINSNEAMREVMLQKNREYQKKNYYKYKEEILNQMKIKNEIKREQKMLSYPLLEENDY
jgi:hypothetical protein